ncbi:MAG: BufA1 family periplasmic bufferin-type metallophore [Steroidobacteraceae bacterium]
MKIKTPPIATSALISAIALVVGSSAAPTFAQNATMMQKLDHMLQMHPGADKATIMGNMQRAHKYHLTRCYGINAIAKNDCASGVHSCAGQSTRADDPTAFILLPAGDCEKIAGGSLKGPM